MTVKALMAWTPESDDRVTMLLMAEADRREAGQYILADAENVIAFLLNVIDNPPHPQLFR